MTLAPLAVLLRSLADEMARLAVQTDAMHEVVVAAGGANGAAFTQRAQGIDHAWQTLENLRAFLHRLAESTPGDWQLDAGPALDGLHLSALKNRLDPAATGEEDGTASGDFELF